MRRSTDHIPSTHGGKLPRPADLDARLPAAVEEVVEKQIASIPSWLPKDW